MWFTAIALAGSSVPPPWQPAVGGPSPDWLVRSGTVWLRDGDTCFAVRAEDASRAVFRVRVCEVPPPARSEADPLVCDVHVALSDGWEWRDQQCRMGLTGPGGSRGTEFPKPWPALVADQAGVSATWSPAVSLEVRPGRAMVEQRPCDPGSLAELTKEARKSAGKDSAAQAAWLADRGIVDGIRRCDASEGVAVEPIVPGTRTVTPGTRKGTTAVDCRVACAEPPAVAAVAAARAEVDGKWFYDPAAPTLRLYADRAACDASPPAEVHVPRDLCTTLGAQIQQAK